MGSKIENKSAALGAPRPVASAWGQFGVNAFTGSNGRSEGFIVPRGAVGKFVKLLVTGSNCQFGFATGSAPSLTFDAYSTVDAQGNVTSSAARGETLLDGQPTTVFVPAFGGTLMSPVKVYMGYRFATTGSLEMRVDEGEDR